MEVKDEQTTDQPTTEKTEEVTEEKTENSQSSDKNSDDTEEKAENEGETVTADPPADNEVEVLFVDPAPQTTYKTDAYEIDIIHSMTTGDILISTLLAVLIIVVFLSRVLGRRY